MKGTVHTVVEQQFSAQSYQHPHAPEYYTSENQTTKWSIMPFHLEFSILILPFYKQKRFEELIVYYQACY